MKKASVFIIFILLFSFISINLFAQTPQNLRFGARTNGRLPVRDNVWYRVTPNQNSFMVIEVNSDDFDAYVEICDENRELIISDDDSGEGTNAKAELYVTRGTNYLIRVRSYDGQEGGNFRILASYKPAPQAVELRLGTKRTVNLARRDEHWYSVRATSAGVITVQTSENEFDTFLEAYDSAYKQLATDDDSGDDNNAKIDLVAEANQTYFFKLRAYNNEDSGSYSILATLELLPEDEGNTSRSRAVSMRIGESKQAYFFNSGESRWYSFVVPSRGANVAVYTEGDLDTTITLYDSREQIAYNDDPEGGGLNAYIMQRLNAGTYYVEVKAYGDATGRFTIVVSN